jgi:hypothetical protein
LNPVSPDPFASSRTLSPGGCDTNLFGARATKGQEPRKGRTGGNAMFWKFIDALAAIAMAIAALS